MSNPRKRPRPHGKGQPAPRPRLAWPPAPPQGKPTYYRLGAEITVGSVREAVTIIERGPLGLCEQRGMQAGTYGIFHLDEDGIREWHRPVRIWIMPVEEEAKAGEHAS